MINDISQNPAAVAPLRPAGERQRIGPPDSAAAAPEAASPLPSPRQEAAVPAVDPPLDAVVEKLNDFVQNVQRELEFSIDEENGEVVVKVVDARTKDVVREIPPEEVREMRKRLQEASQVVFDHQSLTSVLFQAKA